MCRPQTNHLSCEVFIVLKFRQHVHFFTCPKVLEGCEWTEALQEDEVPTYPKLGYHISARASKPSPIASFLRHVASMHSPSNPSYVGTRIHPAADVRGLRREASLENIAAHQRYLEKLEFDINTGRSWSNRIQDQIMGEAAQVHLLL